MKECLHCKYAEWNKTGAGRMHPSGDGRCGYKYKIPILPSSFYWVGAPPFPYGGFINRREKLKDHCAYYQVKNENP